MFAPWRGEYIRTAGKTPGCVMCNARDADEGPENLVVHREDTAFVLMNLYPYNSGHVMVAPARHVGRLTEATPEELASVMALARRLEAVLTEAYHPDGFNVGMNVGRAAGAGVADHLHLHVVPRWSGDANFMTVVGDTRVIPEDPRQACLRLRALFTA